MCILFSWQDTRHLYYPPTLICTRLMLAGFLVHDLLQHMKPYARKSFAYNFYQTCASPLAAAHLFIAPRHVRALPAQLGDGPTRCCLNLSLTLVKVDYSPQARPTAAECFVPARTSMAARPYPSPPAGPQLAPH